MEPRKVFFSFNSVEITIQCYKGEKMKIICQKFANLIGEKYDNFIYLYIGKLVKLKLSWNEIASKKDKESKVMHILVYKLEEGESIENKSWEKNPESNIPKLHDIIISSIDIKKKGNELQMKNSGKNQMLDSINLKKNNNQNDKLLNDINNIKSKYIIEEIFSYISEKTKLKIIKYNKKVQKKMDIKLINYQFFSGRYIIYESNDIGKEYSYKNDNLIYNGKYKNGERNGVGKEYDFSGNIIFEGEYLNSKKWVGIGREYLENKI